MTIFPRDLAASIYRATSDAARFVQPLDFQAINRSRMSLDPLNGNPSMAVGIK